MPTIMINIQRCPLSLKCLKKARIERSNVQQKIPFSNTDVIIDGATAVWVMKEKLVIEETVRK